MKKIMIKFWWIFPLLLGFSMLTMSLTFAVEPLFVENIVTILFLLTIVALPVSWVYLLLNRQWWKCIFSFVTSAIIVFVLWLPLVLGALSAPDRFGKNHPIPTGLKYELPLSAECDSLIAADSLHPDTYLQIWNDIQGGMYQYDFYYGHLPAGEIFLRCYEATKNIALSEHDIKESSRVAISPQTQFGKIVNRQPFTIYEGDWEDYYAARIEVWYKNAETNQESKLLEKIYRVEGWMR